MEDIRKHGIDKWVAILKDESLAFCRNGKRTAVDLEGKYLNLKRIGIKGAGQIALLNNDHPTHQIDILLVDHRNLMEMLLSMSPIQMANSIARSEMWIRFMDMSRDARHQETRGLELN
jgi:hypothetical protein